MKPVLWRVYYVKHKNDTRLENVVVQAKSQYQAKVLWAKHYKQAGEVAKEIKHERSLTIPELRQQIAILRERYPDGNTRKLTELLESIADPAAI